MALNRPAPKKRCRIPQWQGSGSDNCAPCGPGQGPTGRLAYSARIKVRPDPGEF